MSLGYGLRFAVSIIPSFTPTVGVQESTFAKRRTSWTQKYKRSKLNWLECGW